MPDEIQTPLTDAEVFDLRDVGEGNFDGNETTQLVKADFARDLEIRLAVAETKLAYAEDAARKGEEGRNLGTAFEECAKALNRALEVAEELEDYLGHQPSCDRYLRMGKCDCGLDKALAALESIKPKEEEK